MIKYLTQMSVAMEEKQEECNVTEGALYLV